MPSSDTLGKIADETNSVISLSSLTKTKPMGNLGINSEKISPDTTPAMVVRRREIVSGGPFERSLPQIILTTDVSMLGWGATCNLQTCQGCWNVEQKTLHINILEMEAVIQSVLHFHTLLKGKVILLRSDNVAVVTYIHKQGGTKSPTLCMKTWQLFKILRDMPCTIIATHLEGIKNVEEDHLSRHKVLPTEWCLNSLVLQQIFQFLGNPLINLFALDQNHCLPTFCSLRPSVKALAIDAFTLDWPGMIAYAYPPICLIPRVLQQVENQECIVILIAPFWPKRLVHEIAQPDSRYTTDSTRQERPSKTNNREIFRPKSQSFLLGSMENLKQPLSTTDFSEGVEKLVEASLREGTRKDYKAKFQRYQNWCLGRGLYPWSAPLKDILEFLAELHHEGLAYNTLCGYRSMLSLYHDPIDGLSLGSHPLIGKLLKGAFNLNPPMKKFCPEWKVSIVLDFLTKEPFVPVESCALKFLTLKVCFLLAITSARRADDFSKLSITPSNCRLFDNKFILIPDMLIKQDRPSHVGVPIEIEAYETDVNLCLVKLLPFYLAKVHNLRQRGCDSIFVRPQKKPTSQTISRWLVRLIRPAYESKRLPLGKNTGHSTRALGPSWAEFRCVYIWYYQSSTLGFG